MVIKNFTKKTYTIINPQKKKIDISKGLPTLFFKNKQKRQKIINFYLLNNLKKINTNIIFEKKNK